MPLRVSQYPEFCHQWKYTQGYYRYHEFDLYVIFIPEQVIYFYSGKPDIQCINGQLGDIVIVNAGSIYQITPIGIVTANRIDFISGIFCHFATLAKDSLPRNARFLLEISRLDKRRYDALVVCVRLIICLT